MAFTNSFAAGFALKSCRYPSGFVTIARPLRGVRSFSYASRHLGALPKHGVFRAVVQTRAFSRTIPVLSVSKTSSIGADVASTSLDTGVTAAINATETASVSSGIMENAINHLPAALQYGDFAAMGLTGYSPAAIVRWSMELINVSTGLPWFWTIVAGSLAWRLILLPLTIGALRNSAKLLPLQPKILQAQENLMKIRKKGDVIALQKEAAMMKKIYKDAGVNLGITMVSPFVQAPVALGVFFGVRKMCELPVPQLTHSGVSFLQDLTVPDPYMVLPIAFCAAVNLQIFAGASELDMRTRPQVGHIMNGLRILSFLGIGVMNSFPAGLMISLLATTIATSAQSLTLRIPAVRRALGIPIVPREHRGKMPSFLDTYKYLVAEWKRKTREAKKQAAQSRRY